MSNNGNYGNERSLPGDTEFGVDPAAGGFFNSDYKRYDDLKEMLDSNKDSLKLEAMKRIIGMVAKGKNASDLFPAVVKNVVSKNIEVKKLVYVYLVRYAEEQQDLALLSISSFQRALKEPNQLIRAGALRVLSSIRVSIIVPIVMLAIKDAAADMSPYVRKTAAHAIPKLYSLDKEQKPELITLIQKLLADRTVLVMGSAVMAYTEVCPERVDLIHQVYRKLCALLVDVDEWGQVVIVNMLTRYARSQFTNPNLHDYDYNENNFYDSGSSEKSENIRPPPLDPDHRLLLRSTRPLLQSRNAAVVMAVAQLYHHCAPKSEGPLAARALVRILRSHVEVQSIVLDSIASISSQKKELFQPYIKNFFIRTSDPTRIKVLKLDILTNLATESNVSTILRELQTYISNSDKVFVAATIQAIGRCACAISEITDSCLSGLVSLLSNKDEAVVAESVIVIKRLIQTQAADPKDIIIHIVKLLDSITVAQARAAILWLLGEHSNRVPTVAPDILRKVAKTFSDENGIVKLQVLNLAIKLYITNPKQTELLCQYVFNLAKYDQNYDIRDRARLLKQFILDPKGRITSCVSKIFLAHKPAPQLVTRFKDYEDLQLGSLSHYINTRAVGYEPLPPFPKNPPSGHVREVEAFPLNEAKGTPKQEKTKMFANISDISSSADCSSSETESSSSGSEDVEREDEEDEDDEEEDGNSAQNSSNEKTDSGNSSESESSESSCSEKKPEDELKESETVLRKGKVNLNLDLLLNIDDMPTVPVMTPSYGRFLIPADGMPIASPVTAVAPNFVSTTGIELLNRIHGKGLSVTYRFTRNPHLFSPSMTNIGLVFTNHGTENVCNIHLEKKNLPMGVTLHEFALITCLGPNCSLPGTIGIDFNDTTVSVPFQIVSSLGTCDVAIKPPVGELLKPVSMSEETFLNEQSKLRGMNEHICVVRTLKKDFSRTIFQVANVGACPSSTSDTSRFAGQTLTSSSIVLVTLNWKPEEVCITVNSEKVVTGSMLINELKSWFK
ncbi:AP-3 complex subunit beta-2 isoform X2 [Agrilus planipennis]|nr:AP-3 complex subunit beta-2 isoform X2 [Agrilus planipennis]XP_018329495.1 AP-3 complex subunit beta-2 isoform X2 [Agrilus planipennis]